jgi:hypothetical protein
MNWRRFHTDLNPLSAVPTGTRRHHPVRRHPGYPGRRLTLVAPWQKLTIFSIRAEEAEI